MNLKSTRLPVILLSGCLLAAPLPGCSKGRNGASGKVRVLCSTFPVYVFTRNVAAGRNTVQVDLMLPADMGCPHDYVLTPQDMQKIASADVFIANGLGLEEFLGDPLKQANPKIAVIDSSRGITDVIQLRSREGRAHEHAGPNPHLFASPRMAARIAKTIAAELAKIDPGGAETYDRNAQAYAARLEKLADDFAAAARSFRSRKIVTEHAVFDYLARDAGLEIVAVVEDAPGQAPSAAEMIDLARVIRRSGAAAVFTEPQYPANVGRKIADEAGVPVAVLDPIASGPADAPLDYYEKVMFGNLDTLKRVLGQ